MLDLLRARAHQEGLEIETRVMDGHALELDDNPLLAWLPVRWWLLLALALLLWIGIAGAALVAGWRGVFQLAVAVVAFRLIALSFELASDLLLSGFGLVVAGLMILLVAFVAVRISRQFAPQSERDDRESAA